MHIEDVIRNLLEKEVEKKDVRIDSRAFINSFICLLFISIFPSL